MNNLVKKIMICTAILMIVTANTVQAQKGDMAVGGNFAVTFNTNDFLVGFAPKFQYYITDNFRGEADLTILLPKNSITYLDLAVNAHYLFEINEQTFIYPIAGLGIFSLSRANSNSISSWPTASLGGGIEYALSSRFTINGELKYKLTSESAHSFGMLTAGIAYKF